MLFPPPIATPPSPLAVCKVSPTRVLPETFQANGATYIYPCGACHICIGGGIVADALNPTRDTIGLRDPERRFSAYAYPARVYVERGGAIHRMPINHVARSVLGIHARGTVVLLPPSKFL